MTASRLRDTVGTKNTAQPTDRLRPTDKALIVFHPLEFIYPLAVKKLAVIQFTSNR
jgi:hypothetical protein